MKAVIRITAALAALAVGVSCGRNAAAAPDNISAVSAILIEAQTGTVIYEKNADERRAMASTTKIMTALLTIEAGDLDREFTCGRATVCRAATSCTGYFSRPGTTLRMRLRCLSAEVFRHSCG